MSGYDPALPLYSPPPRTGAGPNLGVFNIAGITVLGLGTGNSDITPEYAYTLPGPASIAVVGVMETNVTTAANAIAIGELLSDGALVPGQVIGPVRSLGSWTTAQSWALDLPAGSHTLKMIAHKDAAVGVVNIRAQTRLSGLIVPR